MGLVIIFVTDCRKPPVCLRTYLCRCRLATGLNWGTVSLCVSLTVFILDSIWLLMARKKVVRLTGRRICDMPTILSSCRVILLTKVVSTCIRLLDRSIDLQFVPN